ncbi:MAG: DNA topoisomerase I [Acidobacteria bacterium]|jgi:DNA topoisomerase-1|nr:DNA topoisomerase I [Acidobacteriota bacterium]HJN43554.1 type I DNA topoisomerase [Vicinamibacterales bacterium]|tara:strand:+ start:3565 stop:5982 length:2418 start_codon:yes stop_codon:yes gene_type:complete
MPKALVVVESPAKAKTINKYLGRDFKVVASMGHIRDLPKSKLGVDIEDGFAPVYEPIPARKKVIKELRDAAKGVNQIYVATDPDREGEAIGWHLANELGSKKRKVGRLLFNEITKKAVLEALKQERTIDQRMVDAQQARRVLDRLVGYKLSPLLWDKVRRGLSAGRVQSVALKLVCDREAAVESFVAEEYWHITARLAGAVPPEFDTRVVKKGTHALKVTRGSEADAVVSDLEQASFVVRTVATKERKKQAPPPFITSKLQQAARFPVKKTMMIAQQLYEGIELPGEGAVGLITYMRTDSTRVADEALTDVRAHIGKQYGADCVPDKPRYFRKKADAQDAHEAIRPTGIQFDPETVRAHLTREQYSIYRLIWNRFVASQMAPATFDDTTVEVEAGEYLLRAKGSVPKFSGWLTVYEQPGADPESEPVVEQPAGTDGEDGPATGLLPKLVAGDVLELRKLNPEQKFTQPPPRFSEATLVKELEENGIGRPSTYASIIGVLQAREYAEKVEGRFRPTRLGRLVIDLLAKSFDDILAVDYTRGLEEQLDKIEEGEADYGTILQSFYEKFSADLGQASEEMPNIKGEGLPSEETCDKCGAPMVVKVGRFGVFLACSAYPECQNTREVDKTETNADEEPEACETCGKPMVVKRGRFGQFLACSGYPDCKTTRKLIETKSGMTAAKPDQMLDEKCPRCESNLVVKQGRFGEFTACSNYPKCRYVKLKSTGVACPKDGADIVERKSKRGRTFYGCSNYPDCDFTLWNRPISETCPTCGAPYLVEKITKRWGHQVLCDNDDCDYKRTEEAASA